MGPLDRAPLRQRINGIVLSTSSQGSSHSPPPPAPLSPSAPSSRACRVGPWCTRLAGLVGQGREGEQPLAGPRRYGEHRHQECAERARRGPSRRGCARWCVVRAAGIAGVSSSTRELCERWLPQAASVSEARACRRDAAQTRKRAEPACTQRAGEPLCTTPRAVASASPPSFLARVLRGSSRFLSMPSTPDPLSSARRHPRAARSPRRAARTAHLEQQRAA